MAQQALHSPQFDGVAQVTTGGSLPGGEYQYKVTALNQRGETPGGDRVAPRHRWSLRRDSAGRMAPDRGSHWVPIYRAGSDGQFDLIGEVGADRFDYSDSGADADGPSPPNQNRATTPGKWRAAFGGVIRHVSTSPGYFRDVRSERGYSERYYWGRRPPV